MPTSKSILATAMLVTSALLCACGGGGGSDSAGASDTHVNSGVPGFISAAPVTAVVPEGSVAISGTVTFDSIPNTDGPLRYDAIVSKPVRGAQVDLVDGGTQTVLANGTTDANGNYSIAVPQGHQIFVRVRATLQRTGSGPTWNVSVRDNTQANGLYALETEPFLAAGIMPMGKDIHAPSGWTGSTYTGPRTAAPFAILDVIYTNQAKVLTAAPSANFPPLSIYWSVNNTPASGNIALGQIGSTYFDRGSNALAIYVLGKVDVDTDEYDQSVVAHEWGHYYQAAFSRDDSPGGAHGSLQSLDFRLAFSEGWGNAWSGIALARSTYTDSYDVRQASGLDLNLAAGAANNKGWFDEDSIQYALWTLNQLVGFQSIHDAMTGPLRAGASLSSVEAFNAALKAVSNQAASSFAPLLASQAIDPNADAWGSTETNSGGSAVALPLYRNLTPGTALGNVCVSNSFGAAQGDNKLGNYVYVRFVVPAAKTYQIQVWGGGAATDPDFRVYNTSGVVLDAYSDDPAVETGSVALQQGDYVLAITDYANTSPSTCFNVTVN
jgi:hypothetical protein